MKKLIIPVITHTAMSNLHAASFTFDGNIASVDFTLDSDAKNVKLWTDSHIGGVNSDPVTALWNKDSGSLIGSNDNNASINPFT